MRKFEQGFTLIELLTVMSIVAFIVSAVMVSLQGARLQSRDTRRIADFKNLTTALDLYYTKYNMYPCGSFGTPSGVSQTDADWLHEHNSTDSFLNSFPISSFVCPQAPTYGLVTDGLTRYGIHDPVLGRSVYIYEVTNDRQTYILYSILESPYNVSKMTGDGGLSNCFYEVGNGVGRITPYWLCN